MVITVKKTLKIVSWILLALLMLFVSLIFLIRLQSIQNYIVGKVEPVVKKKLGTDFHVDRLFISFPKNVTVEGLYLEDKNKDTLVYIGALDVNIGLLELLDHKVAVKNIHLKESKVYLSRDSIDGVFNYNFIIDSLENDTSKQTSGSEWTVDVGGVGLDNSMFQLDDHLGQNFIHTKIGEVKLDLDQLILDSLFFKIDELQIDHTLVDIKINTDTSQPADTVAESGKQTYLSVDADQISIDNSHVTFTSRSQKFRAEVGNLQLEHDEFSLHEQFISSENITLSGSLFHYAATDSDSSDTQSPGDTTDSDWNIRVDAITLSNNRVGYDDGRFMPMETGLDYHHLSISELSSEIHDVDIKGNEISAEVKKLGLKEKSGLNLQNLRAKLELQGERLTVDELNIKTDSSTLSGQATFYTSSFSQKNHSNENPSLIKVRADINPVEILYFTPKIAKTWFQTNEWVLQADLRGWLNDLTVKSLYFKIDNTDLRMNGKISGLPEWKETYINLPELSVRGYSRDINRFLPDSTLPGSIQIPDTFSLESNLRGQMDDLSAELNLSSSMGDVHVAGQYKNDATDDIVYIKGNLEVNKFDLGKLLKNEKLGNTTIALTFDGSGNELNKTQIEVNGKVDLLEYNNYAYEDMAVKGKIKGKSYQGNLSISDPNLKLGFNGLVDMSDSIPKMDMKMELENANLQALHFTQDEIIAHGLMKAKIETDREKHINGSLDVRDVKVIRNGMYYSVDSLLFVSLSEKAKTRITIDSDILRARLEGDVDVQDIPDLIRHHFDNYFTDKTSQPKDSLTGNQQFSFSVALLRQDLLTEVLVPGLEKVTISNIKGHFDNRKHELEVVVDIPQMNYQDIELDSLILNVKTNEKEINGDLSLGLIKNNLIYVSDLDLTAVSVKDALDLTLSIPFQDQKSFQLGGRLQREDGTYVLRLDQGEILFNGQKWNISGDNALRFGKTMWIDNLTFQKGDSRLAIFSKTTASQDSVLRVECTNFDLAALGKPLGQDTSLVSGKADGYVSFLTNTAGLSFNSNFSIHQLAFKGTQIGEMELDNKYVKSRNEFTLTLQGNGGKANLNGFLAFSENEISPEFDISGKLDHLELSGFEPLFLGQAKNIGGSIDGEFSLTGNIQSPQMSGYIQFNKFRLTPAYTSVPVQMDDERLTLKGNSIVLKNFVINDESNGEAELTGEISSGDFKSYHADLHVTTRDFLVFNTTENENDLYYGKLRISGDANVKGNEDLLTINGSVGVTKGSRLVYQVPLEEASVISGEGLVNYIDQDAEENSFLQKYETILEDTTTSAIKGLDVSANISINDGSQLSIIVDRQTGDRLDVSGNADLTFNMPPNGDISLSGRYAISSGSYKLNFYEFVKRKFDIVEGSYIYWTGDPLEARLDVTTRYKVETLPPVTDITDPLPFYVDLHIQGKILEPSLSFDVSMPPDIREQYPDVFSFVQNVNSQQTELNKQIFSLVVFNSFMLKSSQPQTGDVLSNTARHSLSRILSQQLNRLAGNLDFVNLDLKLESYQVAGKNNPEGKTNLEVGLSKSFFNNRVKIKVSGNVGLEGEEQQKQQNLSDYAGDIIIEYKLTEDGRYRIEAFSKNEYDGLDQGEITKTGLGFIVVKDYNKLNEIFKEKNKE